MAHNGHFILFGVWALKAHLKKKTTAEDMFTFHQKKKTGPMGGDVEKQFLFRVIPPDDV